MSLKAEICFLQRVFLETLACQDTVAVKKVVKFYEKSFSIAKLLLEALIKELEYKILEDITF